MLATEAYRRLISNCNGVQDCRAVKRRPLGIAGLLGGETPSVGNRGAAEQRQRCPPEAARLLGDIDTNHQGSRCWAASMPSARKAAGRHSASTGFAF